MMKTNSTNTKTFSWKSATILCFSVGLLAFGLSAALQSKGFTVQALLAQLPVPGVEAPETAGTGGSFEMPGKPSRLRIPAIGVDAHVQSVGLSWKGTGDMGIPTNFTDVAWYKAGPVPGEPGAAVIDGHLDGKDVERAVFYDLDKLKPGDLVEVVDADGRVLQFRVVKTKVYDYDAAASDVFSSDASKTRLNLITCAGDWIRSERSYDKRVVVFTELETGV